MGRLVDEMAEARRLSPKAYVYNFMRDEPIMVPRDPATDALHDEYLARADSAPVIAADEVADFIFGMPREDWDLSRDLPCVIPPGERQFIEMRRPKAGRYFDRQGSSQTFPEAWGWLIDRLDVGQVRDHARMAGGTADPRTAGGLMATLGLKLGPPFDRVVTPVFATVVPLDDTGTPAGDMVPGYPFHPDAGMLPDAATLHGYFTMLLMPALMTLAFLNTDLTDVEPVESPAAVQKARARRGKPAFRAYNRVSIARLVDVLRFDGQSGIRGLKDALRSCKHHFRHGAPRVIGIA